MKKILLCIIAVMFCVTLSFARVTSAIWTSSYTATNESTIEISSTKTARSFHSIIVSSPTAGGLVTVYDSQGSATNIIGVVSLNAVQVYPFDVFLSSGLTYTSTGNSNGFTITYRDRN